MTNSISNTVAVSGGKSGVARFKMAAEGPDNPYASDSASQGWSVFSFPRLCPPPEHILKGDTEDVTYWECEYWGCKWGADEAVVVSHTPNSITYRFHTPWAPPLKLLTKVSADFPDLTFELSFSGEITYGDAYRFKAGNRVWVEHYNGYFIHRPDLGGAVHHRWIWIRVGIGGERDEVRRRLARAGMLIKGEEGTARAAPGFFCFTSRHDATAVASFLRNEVPGFGKEVWDMAFTLDEEKYVGSIHTMLQNRTYTEATYPYDLVRIPEDLRPLYAICERGLTPTDEEADWIVRGLLAAPDEYPRDLSLERLERLSLHVGPELFRQRYASLIRETAARWQSFSVTGEGGPVAPAGTLLRVPRDCPLFRGSVAFQAAALLRWLDNPLLEDQSAEWGYGDYAPTREELEFALDGHRRNPDAASFARVAEIEAAVLSPHWASTWPIWDLRFKQADSPA